MKSENLKRVAREVWGSDNCRCVQFRYYLTNAAREARKRWVNFSLGSFSCLVVVVVAAVCFTILDRAPVVLLQEAETKHAQIDMYLKPTERGSESYLNFSAMAQLLSPFPEYSYSSPRTDFDVMVFDEDCAVSAFENFTTADASDPKWLYEGPLANDDSDRCGNLTTNCLSLLCTGTQKTFTFTLIDTKREASSGIGRLWPYGAIPEGQVIVTDHLAALAGLSVGTKFYASMRLPFLLDLAAAQLEDLELSQNMTSLYNWGIGQFLGTINVPLTVHAVSGGTSGKFDTSADFIMGTRQNKLDIGLMEYSSFLPYVLKHLHPSVEDPDMLTALGKQFVQVDNEAEVSQSLSSVLKQGPRPMSAWDSVSYAVYALTPPRTLAYMDTNYDNLQATLVHWSTKAVYYTGYPTLDIQMPLFDEFANNQFRSLYLGLILSVILTILFILSVMLIYSLLMISIETRTFELGVHRMLGISRRGVIELLVTQAFTFSIPAWIVGLIASAVAVRVIMANLEESVQVPLPKTLTGQSILWASVLGLLSPLVAAILPIRAALSGNLHDTLDNTRSKTKGVVFSIERAQDAKLSVSWLIVGISLTIFGFLIYYLLPLALISFNLNLFFQIFFSILIGMLFGLILLSLNLEVLVERILVWSFLWWEKRAIPSVVLKNLVAHRGRNRKTTIMFALSLSFILFITVAYKVQMNTALQTVLKSKGARVAIRNMAGSTTGQAVDSWLTRFPVVEDYAWVSHPYTTSNERYYVSNLGHVFNKETRLRGVSPNFFDVSPHEFYTASMEDTSTGLTVSEQLYTVAGSQASIQATSYRDYFMADQLTPQSLLTIYHPESWIHRRSVYTERNRALAYLDAAAGLTMSKFSSNSRWQDTLVSFPTLLRVIDDDEIQSSADILMQHCLIKLRDGAEKHEIDSLVVYLRGAVDELALVEVFDVRGQADALAATDTIMELVFSVATAIAMGLCLFSLMASMYTNIYEQSKEIAILRAIGFEGWTIVRIYVYEAFTLTMSAAILGVMIGTVLANTMVGQIGLFSQVPTTFQFPYKQLLQTVAVAMCCALVSSFFPALYPAKRNISRVMRMVL